MVLLVTGTALFLFFFFMIPRPPRSTLFPYTSSSDLDRRLHRAQRVAHGPGGAAGGCPRGGRRADLRGQGRDRDRKSTRLNSSHTVISYAVFCLKKKKLPGSAARLCSLPPWPTAVALC